MKCLIHFSYFDIEPEIFLTGNFLDLEVVFRRREGRGGLKDVYFFSSERESETLLILGHCSHANGLNSL